MAAHVFGAATCGLGIITLIWHEYNGEWHFRVPAIMYAVSAAQILGGTATAFRPTAKLGAVILGALYLIFAISCVPAIITTPQVYNSWDSFFEEFSLFAGSALVYAGASLRWTPELRGRIGSVLVGVCVASFTIEQAVYLSLTAGDVPKWLPPNQLFWAVTTTVLFGLAAVALITGRMALGAARLLTLMLVLFGPLVWVPLLVSEPRSQTNWGELAETLAIAGTVWILADVLRSTRVGGATAENRRPVAARRSL